jgi:hypothetical protein
MCLGCCCRLEDKCGKLPIIRNPINHALLGLMENSDENFRDERDSLEHLCIHYGDLETLIYLLNDPDRIAYRKGKKRSLFYYNLFRGLCSMIIKNQYPKDVIDLFIDRLKNELIFPLYIQLEFIGIIRSVELFELDLQTIIFMLCRHGKDKGYLNTEFMASFPFEDGENLLKNQRWFLQIKKQRLALPQWIIRKICSWMNRTRRRMLISLLNEEVYNDLSKSIVSYNFQV